MVSNVFYLQYVSIHFSRLESGIRLKSFDIQIWQIILLKRDIITYVYSSDNHSL